MSSISRRTPLRGLAFAAMAVALGAGAAPANAQINLTPAGLPNVPTTRVLAIGRLGAKSNLTAMRSGMPEEVRETAKLYLAGKIADWYVRKDAPGVVFVLDVRDVSEARKLLDTLPFGRDGLLDFDLIPLGPLAPLSLLLPKP